MGKTTSVFALLLAVALLSCGGDDKGPTIPGGWTVILDSHDAGAWQTVDIRSNAAFQDGRFTAGPGTGFGEWRSRRVDLTSYREARLRCRMTRPGGGDVYVYAESNVPGSQDLLIVTALANSTVIDSSMDVSLENALGFRESSVLVRLYGGSDGSGPVMVSIGDLQVVGRR